MTDKEAKTRITELIEARVGEGIERMRSFRLCRQIHDNLRKEGYGEQMAVFRSYVLMATVSHPEWDEIMILKSLADRMGIDPSEYA